MNPRYGDFDTYHMAASADRRSDSQLRGRRRRSQPNCNSRQLLLGQHDRAETLVR